MTRISRRNADRPRPIRFAGFGFMVLVAMAGCSERDEVPETHRIDGTIEQIDLNTGEVTVRFFSEKHKREASVTGKATPETEILINGQLATLADLHVGERLTVIGYVKSQSTGKQVIARSVLVQRSAPIRRAETSPGNLAHETAPTPNDQSNGATDLSQMDSAEDTATAPPPNRS